MFDADDFKPTTRRLDRMWGTLSIGGQECFVSIRFGNVIYQLDEQQLSTFALGAVASLSPFVQSLLKAVQDSVVATQDAVLAMYDSLQPTLTEINEMVEDWFKDEIMEPRPKPLASLYAPRHIPPKGVDRVYHSGKSHFVKHGHLPKNYRGTRRKGHRHEK